MESRGDAELHEADRGEGGGGGGISRLHLVTLADVLLQAWFEQPYLTGLAETDLRETIELALVV